MIRTILFTLLIAVSHSVFAQNAFSPDRPGFGFSSGTTAPGMFGLEAGITHSEFGTNIGEFFFRAGLTDALEAQIELGSVFIDKEGKTGRSLQFAILKYKVFSSTDGSFQFSLLNRTSLPFLNNDIDEYFTQIIALADFALTPELSLNTNFGYGNYIFSDFDVPTFYFTVNPGYVVTPGTSVYLGLAYNETDFFSSTDYEFGVAHSIHSNSQIDLGVVFDDDSNPFLKVGIATRF